MDVDKSIKYMQRILRVTDINKYKQVLVGCKELKMGLSEDQWALGVTMDFTMEQLWTWAKMAI